MHRLSSAFILGYHGCDQKVAEKLLAGSPFLPSENDFDWLGPGVYFWEANPFRAYEFATEAAKRKGSKITHPSVVGAVLDLGLCFDLTTRPSIEMLKIACEQLAETARDGRNKLPDNSPDFLRRPLDCAVIRRVHTLLEQSGSEPIDSVTGVFTEGRPVYPGAGFQEKTHIQVAICNLASIKGVFRLAPADYKA